MAAILLCADSPDRFDVPPGVVQWIPELCDRPRQLAEIVPEEETDLVVGVHRAHANLGNLQAAVRRLGFDPLGVGVLDLDAVPDLQGLNIAVAAARAWVSSYPGADAGRLKMLSPERKSRRDFLTVGAPRYVGAPGIDTELCVAANGCRMCATECPSGALTREGGRIAFDVNTCVACGICVTTCPTGATRNPSADFDSLETVVRAVVESAQGQVAIRYRCRESVVEPESGWYQLEVPCTGMLTVGWLLAPLGLGAVDVDAVPCGTGGCRLGNEERLAVTMEDFSAVLGRAGEVPPLEMVEPFYPSSGGAAVAAVLPHDSIVDFVSAPIGLVTIDETTCTACEMCATICPTDALISDPDAMGVRIEFDPRVCVACGQCVGTCPELSAGAIGLNRRFDAGEWALGARVVREEDVPVCEVCGGPVAPAAMLTRIQEMLTGDDTETMALISRRCVDCRGR